MTETSVHSREVDISRNYVSMSRVTLEMSIMDVAVMLLSL